MTSATVVGSTGLVGSHILNTLISLPAFTDIHTISRRAPVPSPPSKLHPIIDPDTTKWASQLSSLQPSPPIFFSGLASTRAQAGGFANQRKIDYDLNLELAKAAKQAGVKVYVLISSAGTGMASLNAYARMKLELEDAVRALNFEHTVLVRPGFLIGDRESPRVADALLGSVARFAGSISGSRLKDVWAQDAQTVGRAAVSAALRSLNDTAGSPKVWEVEQAEIIRLGRTEWDLDTPSTKQ
ncbi:MAG: hypothetical protein M1817_003211 [Caeruleum heppii]|nr:MAG: hypothetical protein M1817_003211 [Caeruleum heppii]